MYERLADLIVQTLDLSRVYVILEAGCGSGQLSFPLIKRIRRLRRNFRYIAYDISAGPYEGSLQTLKKRLRNERLEKLIEPIEGDVRRMTSIEKQSVDAIVSNELFCDLDRKGLEKALLEFHRILRANGQMAHGELIPVPENEAQGLLIDANTYSMETTQPKPEWFSPFSDEVAALMHKIGFKNIIVKYFETNVKLESKMAIERLKRWKTHPTFLRKRMSDIRGHGLEWPMEHVIFCEKSMPNE